MSSDREKERQAMDHIMKMLGQLNPDREEKKKSSVDDFLNKSNQLLVEGNSKDE